MNLHLDTPKSGSPSFANAISTDLTVGLEGQVVGKTTKAVSVKHKRKPVHGLFLLDKPLGLSSNQALQKVKWLLGAEKAGHTGTLDPLASGVLPICFGAATKFSQIHLDADKTYVALVRLGQSTTTADAEGEVLETQDCSAINLDQAQIQKIQQSFTGAMTQKPPMYSALKVQGRNLYELAREGVTIDRADRNITIHALELCHVKSALDGQSFMAQHAPSRETHSFDWNQLIQEAHPLLAVWVKCSKGTYIRTLGEDIGKALGSCAHLVGLRRVQTGDFDLTQCMSLAELEKIEPAQRSAQLLPVETLLRGHTRVTLDEQDSARFLSGLPRRGEWPDQAKVAVFAKSTDSLLGSAHTLGGELIPDRLLNPLEINSILESLS